MVQTLELETFFVLQSFSAEVHSYQNKAVAFKNLHTLQLKFPVLQEACIDNSQQPGSILMEG